MEAEAKYTYVGIALIVLVAALIAGVIWLNRAGGRGDFKYYTIYFERQPLDGLQIAPMSICAESDRTRRRL